MPIVSIGFDRAKTVFQVHGVDASGQVGLRRRLSRNEVVAFFAKLPPCLVGMEACSSAHHWARELVRLGHTVRLIPPQYVKPYVNWRRTAIPVGASLRGLARPDASDQGERR